MMRLGRIGYVNCYPVYGAMDRGIVAAPGQLVTGTPNELNDALAAGALDVSVISAVAYAEHATKLDLLPDLAISSDGPVRSVILFSRKPPEALDGAKVLLSSSSRTSVLLLDLLLRERWQVKPVTETARTEPGDLRALAATPHDAVLVIGDGALLLRAAGSYPWAVDLGDEWKRWTGLPFVFAVWAARREADRAKVRMAHQALLESRVWGLSHIPELAEQASRVADVDAGDCVEYLSGLDYGLSYQHLAGLTHFLGRLAGLGVVPDGSLSFVEAS
jgi:chorismate dehydratase